MNVVYSLEVRDCRLRWRWADQEVRCWQRMIPSSYERGVSADHAND